MTNHPNRSKQQQATHTSAIVVNLSDTAAPEWVRSRTGILEADRRYKCHAELLAALKAARPHIGVSYSAIQRHGITSQVDAAIAKAEGR